MRDHQEPSGPLDTNRDGLTGGSDSFVWATLPPPLPPRRRFQHPYVLHLVLFLITLVTATWAGALNYLSFELSVGRAETAPLSWGLLLSWDFVQRGFWYSLPALAILAAHEFGHYVYCRRHNVDATLPFFIPAPSPPVLFGTFGAVIRIREAFPSKRALFDVGVAGPIAGFVALLPFLYLGVAMSEVARLPETAGEILYFGEPLLFKAIARLHFGPLPEGHDIVLHPMGFAAWFGLLATAINLLPFGQLDGGHILYSVLGRRAAVASIATLGALVLLTLRSTSWLVFTVLLLVMALVVGFRHPRVLNEHVPIGTARILVAIFALVMFVICFTPVPLEIFIAQPAR